MPERSKDCMPMRLRLRSRPRAPGLGWVVEAEVVTGYLREGFDDSAVVVGAVGELNVAKKFDATKRKADGVGRRDLLYAGGGNGYAETCAD
jgi:hypothetical protein